MGRRTDIKQARREAARIERRRRGGHFERLDLLERREMFMKHYGDREWPGRLAIIRDTSRVYRLL